MMIRFFKIYALFFILNLPTQAQDSLWVLGGQQSSALDILQIDAEGYWYVTGNFQQYLKIGETYLEADKGRYFVGKYAPRTKQFVWFQQLAQPVKKMQLASQALYIAGQFREILVLDAIELNSFEGYASYLAKLDLQTGNFDWIKPFKADKDALVGGLATDAAGNVCITGNFVGKMQIGEHTLRPIQFKNIYLAKFDTAGTLLWVRQGTAGDSELTGISVWGATIDYKGNVILTGTLCGAGLLNTTPVTSGTETYTGEGKAFTTDIFLAKYTPAGEVIWAKSIANQAEAQAFTTDTLGSIYLTGTFRGSESGKHKTGQALFDDFTSLHINKKIDRQSIETCFVAKYSSLGNLIWVKGAESTGESRGTSLAWNTQDNCLYVMGFYYHDVKFGALSIKTAEQGSELFVAGFAPNGLPKSLHGTNSPHDKILKSVCLTKTGKLYGTGLFKTYFKLHNLEVSTDNPNICGFVLKLN